MEPAHAGEGDHDALVGLLQRVQSAALCALGPHDFDPKLYVDLPLSPSADRAAAEAALASATTREDMAAFLARYFATAGSDLVEADPPDFEAEPRGFLPRVASDEARTSALEVHPLWKDLARRVTPDVAAVLCRDALRRAHLATTPHLRHDANNEKAAAQPNPLAHFSLDGRPNPAISGVRDKHLDLEPHTRERKLGILSSLDLFTSAPVLDDHHIFTAGVSVQYRTTIIHY